MYKTRLRGCIDGATSQFGYVETDPSGRYGRFSEADRSIFMQKMEVSEFREILGKGAVKTVYMAFDEVLGIEVAWNQAKLNDAFRSPEELQRLYTEAYLLKNLKHDSIIKFYASWIDIDKRTFNFITEMFTSGTLREYRQKYQRVDIRAIKTWARQILHGLTYLHSHYPPVIHRDLKCDNIFVNGHLGQVKIGDLGLAAVLRRSQRAHSVIGTPEFMAPELYEEEYNELVDVYSFGMCMLEMLTSEYPYSECSNPAQIYKKVTSRKLPEAFYRIEDAQAQKFVGKCLETASKRLPAKELLLDRFLACDGSELLPISKIPLQRITPNGSLEEIMPPMLADSTKTTEMTITGTMNVEDDTIFLKLQIADKDGHIRNVYFLFDILNDTAIDVAMEMVKDLEISDLEPLDIAEMIEEEISSLLPNWKEWGLSQVHHHQHSFSYEDSDDEIHNLFYSNSSASSSQASLWAFKSPYGNPLHHGKSVATSVGDWLQGELLVNDDASSESSLKSYKYSTFNYSSGNEADYNTSPGGEEPLCFAKTCRSANFSTGDIPNAKQHKQQNAALDSWRHGNSNLHGKLTLIRSAVDKRSQLLHRSLVEMIHKRRLFKTVGAVE